MIIFDNIIFSLQKAGGISTVWYEFLSRFIKQPITDDFIIVEDIQKSHNNILRKDLNLDSHFLRNRKENTLTRYLPVYDKGLNKSQKVFHSSYYRYLKGKSAINITTVHDFTYEYFSSFPKRTIHTIQKRQAIKNSQYIICVSNNTKKDLLHFIPEAEQKDIRVVYNGVSDDFFKLKNEDISEKDLPFKTRSYLLFVGSRAHYKNFHLAVEISNRMNIPLVAVGGGGLSNDDIILLGPLIHKNLFKHYLGIDNKFLNILYNNAFILLYPSSYEGFGIPVLEAQKAGCPVIAYNSSSIPEIIGNSAFLLSKPSVSEACSMIEEIRNINTFNKTIEDGLINAKRYSWDNTYIQTLKVYQDILEHEIH